MKFIDKITLPFYRIRNTFRDAYYNFKYRCQRFVRGYADEDIWNLDIWFVETMKKLLSEFIKYNNGYPADLTEEKWKAILVTMNELLGWMDRDDVCQKLYHKESYELTAEQVREAADLATECKDDFFHLFNKYFNHLWY